MTVSQAPLGHPLAVAFYAALTTLLMRATLQLPPVRSRTPRKSKSQKPRRWIADQSHPNHQVSHLCDRRRCFNLDHLQDETPQVNNSRKGCPGPIICPVHGHLIVDLCSHNPTCIRPPRDDVNCCLALKESDPVGWATQTSRQDSSRPSSRAEQLMHRSSSEYEGAAFLDQAVREGLL